MINVSAGMPSYFNIIGNPDQKYDATLTAIEPAPEEISETSSTDSAIYYVGYIEVPNTDRLFRIDMTAQLYIVINQATDAVLVPSAAVKERPAKNQANGESQTNTFIRVLKDDNTIEDRTVEVGIDNRVNAQILSGLQKVKKSLSVKVVLNRQVAVVLVCQAAVVLQECNVPLIYVDYEEAWYKAALPHRFLLL